MPAKITHPARIASHIPGRLRLKIGRGRQEAATMDRLKTQLEGRQGIANVSANPATGSLVVHYDARRHSAAGILGVLEDVDVLVESLTHLSAFGADTPVPLSQAIGDLNARVSHWVGMPVDLAVVLPLAFVGAGAWSIIRNGLMLEKLPGWLLLWLGFDLFVKTHPHNGTTPHHSPEHES